MSGIQGATMKSIRPYKSSEQYLYAMKEDLAEWLKELYDLDIDVGSFLEALETGILLCRHANSITELAREFRQGYPSLIHKLQLPTCGTTCNELAQPGTFQARDNVSNFIQWCRKEMDIKEVLMFETEDLVLRKNEKNFVLCLLEVARRASRFGMSAPTLIQMEEEIEDEIREDLNLPPEETPLPKPQRKPCSFKNLDQMVQCLVSRCTCPVQFSMIKVSEGKYRVGDSSALIFVRILRNHVMVRVGGGWDTLKHYLDKHDPCRCTSLSHKQASKLASPQRMQVQHEITARLTPRTENPNKPQPALIVSRSQSPPPPVEWRPYAPLSLGPGRTLPASSPPGDGRTGGGSSRRCPGLRNSQDPSEARRVRECSVTPSQRAPAAEEKSGSQPTNATQSGRETFSSSSPQQIRNMANGSPALKTLPDPQRGRMAVAVQAATTPPKERTARLVPSAIAARRAVACQPPGSTQKEGKSAQPSRPPSPAQPLGPSASQKAAAKTPVDSSTMLQERGGPERGGRRDPVARRSSSPVKHAHQVRREDNSTRILGTVAPTSCRPLTPCRSGQGELRLRNGGLRLAKDSAFLPSERGLQGGMGPCEERRKTRFDPDALSDKPGLGTGQLDSRPQRKASQVLSGQDHVPRSTGGPGEPTGEKERVYTPLPMNSAEEHALYQSLEEEIWSNIKELEADDNHLPSTENQSGGFKTGKDALVVGCNGLSRLISSLSSLQSGPKAVYGEGVPRSGVYVPDSAAGWRSVGMHYDCVLQELSQTLHHQDCGETERNWPPLSSALVNGSLAEKEVLKRGGSEEERVGSGPEGAEPSPTSQGGHTEVRGNGDTSPGAASAAANPPESAGVPEGANLPQSKPRRSLKKPERVPSIYKLKLRPKIRPRRDNRPEKRPSKIPTPVAYRHLQRASGGKAPAKAHNSRRRGQCCLRQSHRGGHIGGEGGEVALSEHSTPSTQGGNSGEKMATAVGKPTELTDDDDESWV